MPIAVWWKRFPMFGVALFLVGLATLIQLPILYHSQFIIIIEDLPILLLVNFSAILGLTTILILLFEAFIIYYEKKGITIFKLLLFILPIVLIPYYVTYFIPFYIHTIVQLPDFLMPIRDTKINYQFTVSLLISILITFYIAVVINKRLITKAHLKRK